MRRYFDENKKGLDRRTQEGAYFLECETQEEMNLSGNSANIVWYASKPRLRTAQERADRDERNKLDSMTVLSKLDLSRALRALGLWQDVKVLIKSSEDFEDDWNNSDSIDTTDPVFQVGFAMTEIDMDEVKKKIIELGG